MLFIGSEYLNNIEFHLENNTTGWSALQPKISSEMSDYLYDIEEQHKEGKLQQQSLLWDDKMKATQTESALRLGCL